MSRAHLIAAAVTLIATAATAAAVAAPASAHCVAPTRLDGHQSMLDVSRSSGIPAPILFEEVTKCDGLHGGWTPRMAGLLAGRYGPRILRVDLPKGTRLWLQL